MEQRQGVFIALEGTDGSGKGTQFKLLAEYLVAQGYDVATFDFPQYDAPSSYFVKEYLNGNYGTADQVGPYTSSLFYALDRYEAAPKIKEALAEGKVVLSNRFTGSSMGHQGTKFQHAEERRGYFIWLDNLEFEMLKIPRPDMSLVLRVPADIAQSLVDQKEQRSYTDKKRDIHEADLSHLERAVAVYDDLCQLFPKDFQRIDCVRNGQLMSIEVVQDIVRQKIEPLLPAPTAQTSAGAQDVTTNQAEYFTPENLDPATRAAYHSHINELFRMQATMANQLETYIYSQGYDNERLAFAQNLLQQILPVASVKNATTPAGSANELAKLAAEYLPSNHNNEREPLRLADVWPRNELDLLPDMLFSQSNVPLRTLKNQIASWPYEQKRKVFETYLGQAEMGKALDKATYTWDVLSAFEALHALQSSDLVRHIEVQELTPRYGYDVPPLIDEAGLTEQFEECFEMSLKLYSLLQANGYATEAQYATLLGHRARFTVTLSVRETARLLNQRQSSPELKSLVADLHEKLAETHPLLGELLHESQASTDEALLAS